jgi:DNA-directed RNA polymerase subunit M/transcription elongation factor TFIIS
MKACPDCKEKGILEFIDNIIIGSHGSCTLYECTTCGQMMVFDSEDKHVEEA